MALLSDSQRQKLAAEWGYQRLGAPLPEGIALGVLSRCIPEELKEVDMKRLAIGMAAPCAIMAAAYAWMGFMHGLIPGWQQAICWLMIGTGYFGVFTIAHEAARLSLLPDKPELQTVIGTLLMAPSLYSFESWRVAVLRHVNLPNMMGEDAGWQPLTKRQLARTTPSSAGRAWARLVSTTPLKLLGSILHWLASFGGLDLKRYYEPMRVLMIASWSVPFWFMGLVWPAIIAAGGLSGESINYPTFLQVQ